MYVLAPRAVAQLKDIFRFTRRRWGSAQADRYLQGLFQTFDGIAAGSLRSRRLHDAFGIEGHYLAYRRHFVYWRTQRSGRIEIVAVVDQRMLQSGQIEAAFGLSSTADPDD